MAMPKQFSEYVGIRISTYTKKRLIRRAKIMGVKPAVAARLILEQSVDGMKGELK